MAARLAPACLNEMTAAKADISCKGMIIWSRDRVWDPTEDALGGKFTYEPRRAWA
jgi:hypothetical protein